MHDLAATLSLAECVADEARRLGFEAAMIGGAALAARGYARATIDIDLAVAVDPTTKLRSLHLALEALGLESTLKLPEDDDPIGGTIAVRVPRRDSGWVAVVEVVNFSNPGRQILTPAALAIARARPLAGSTLRCVTLEDLVALKLYAGGRKDLADIEQLLANNPGADIDAIRAAASAFDQDGELDGLIDSARKL